MDFSGTAKWVIRIATGAVIVSALIVILTVVTFPFSIPAEFTTGLSTFISIFYYYVPSGNVLLPLAFSLWGLSFTILVVKYGLLGVRLLWKTSE